jgi:hypothetical protein
MQVLLEMVLPYPSRVEEFFDDSSYEFYEHEQISPGPSFTKRGMLLNRSCLSR